MNSSSVTAQDPSDLRALRDVLGSFVTGVTVVTTIDTDGTRWVVRYRCHRGDDD